MRAASILFFILCVKVWCFRGDVVKESEKKLPKILICTLIRNKAHTLPYFLSYLENLDYPKDRIALWFRSDHNEDNSIEIMHLWLTRASTLYHNVDFDYEIGAEKHQNETSKTDWPKGRFSHVIRLKEQALATATRIWADSIFFLDADVFLTNPSGLRHLASYDLPIVSPMLVSDGLYSNFWCGMTEHYYYQRTDEYKEIYHYEKIGNYPVPMVHTAVLVNLNYKQSKWLTFDRQKLLENQQQENTKMRKYEGPIDDIIIFAISAKTANMKMFVSNEHSYGYIIPPLEMDEDITRDIQQMNNLKMLIINDLDAKIRINDEFKKFVFRPEKHKLSLDHIYMINLDRRPERRKKMELCFEELSLDVEHFPAVDGRGLNQEFINQLGIEFLPGYEDPYHYRKMTMGEIGCFLSHYFIWKKMIELSQNEVLILEDDIKFEPYFNERAVSILEQARSLGDWDLIYFGRKRIEDQDEPWVENVNNLVRVGYSYWTLGYAISLSGAKKLVEANPLKKLLPVDEYLPIMFDRHSNTTWKEAFETRNLIAFSAAPLLLYPTHYTGETGYISDTEDSLITSIKNGGNDAQLKSDKDVISKENFDSMLDSTKMDSKYKNNKAIVGHMTDSLVKHDVNEL